MASGGEEALAIAGNVAMPVNLLITDLVMPRMNGRQIADRLHQLRPDLKVIFTSGYTDDVLSRQGVLDPAVHFIQKPFDVRGLRAKVRQVLDE